jgi:predicted nucleic acid-binding protein
LNQQIAIQNVPYGIRANVILPGLMDTPMAVDTRARTWGRPREAIAAERDAQVPLRQKMGTAWDVAHAALFLTSDEANLIEAVDILPTLYERILIPQKVADELQHPRTPLPVRQWMATAPAWLEIHVPKLAPERALARLGAGERDAIVLAQELRADLLIMDDWGGREAAEQRAFRVLGTLGVLDAAATDSLLSLPEVLTRLQATNFRMTPEMVQMLLARDAARKRTLPGM